MTLQRRADEKAKRIAELEAENTALRDVNKRLNNDANLLMESNAQLTEENAALRRDAVTCHYEPATEDEKAMRIAELVAELATLHSRLEFTSCQKADVEAQVLELEEQNAALRRDKLRLVNACEVACIGLAGVTNGEDPRLAIEAAGAACCRAMQGVGMPDGLEEVVASLEAENETLREDAEVIHEIREIIQSFNEKMKVPPYSLVHGGLDNYQTAITGISAALVAAGLMENTDGTD